VRLVAELEIILQGFVNNSGPQWLFNDELLIHQQRGDKFGRANCPQFLSRRMIRIRPNWRRDLNYALSCCQRSFVDSPEPSFNCNLRVEQVRRSVTPVPPTTKPFDLLAEGLNLKNSRGDWTPLELFIAGVRGWEAGLRQ
jgi:hypothetical protein